jgi:aminoglycoside phosphotransferase (APT) family kinase protein
MRRWAGDAEFPPSEGERTVVLSPRSEQRPADTEVVAFLRAHHGEEPADLELLGGGFWSVAFGYRIGGDELVLRINDDPHGFRADQAAMAYATPTLPVPEVLTIGEGLGRWFAISRRHRGRFLESVGPADASVLGPTLAGLLTSLRAVPDAGEVTPGWREWLLEGLTDRAEHPTAGWRRTIEADPATDRVFRTAERRIGDLLDACPDRRQLVHGDLLHANVLVAPAADAVRAVFSWKCSTRGDALYDLAWCTFWGRWHPGIAALDLWDRVVPHLPSDESVDAEVRHHGYELQIGASHLGWYAATDDRDNLAQTRLVLEELLERGPRS